MTALDSWYLENLVCPVDLSALRLSGDALMSAAGRRYPVFDGVPVMLLPDVEQTLGVATMSLQCATSGAPRDPYCLESLGISADERSGVRALMGRRGGTVDPVVAYIVGATNGYAYREAIGRILAYPVPDSRLPAVNGATLLDVGCNWGRWSIAASRRGYTVVGIDPSLGAVLAARRVARQLDLPNRYVVGDARHLPFKEASFDTLFSYSVLQHFSKTDVANGLIQVARVLKPNGNSVIQMANGYGIRSITHQLRRGFREARNFEVRYWTVPELKRTFEQAIGPSELAVDCYFGLGLQRSDMHLMPLIPRAATSVSEILRRVSRYIPQMKYVADSVYITSRKM
jgi:SAM-dependent methyltransferase/uncharacterized protein YbaR (Trm112 family)